MSETPRTRMVSRLSRTSRSTELVFHASNSPPSQPSVKTVNIIRLKNFAAEKLSRQQALRGVLLQEKDEIPPAEFLAKLQVWLALLKRQEEER